MHSSTRSNRTFRADLAFVDAQAQVSGARPAFDVDDGLRAL